MGYFSQSLAEFRLAALGSYDAYILFFHHDQGNIHQEMSRLIGNRAVYISTDDHHAVTGWWFASYRPTWLNSHVFLNSTILVTIK